MPHSASNKINKPLCFLTDSQPTPDILISKAAVALIRDQQCSGAIELLQRDLAAAESWESMLEIIGEYVLIL